MAAHLSVARSPGSRRCWLAATVSHRLCDRVAIRQSRINRNRHRAVIARCAGIGGGSHHQLMRQPVSLLALGRLGPALRTPKLVLLSIRRSQRRARSRNSTPFLKQGMGSIATSAGSGQFFQRRASGLALDLAVQPDLLQTQRIQHSPKILKCCSARFQSGATIAG